VKAFPGVRDVFERQRLPDPFKPLHY
jgi:hypothetical protein